MSSRAQNIPPEQRIELINECRRSGLTDAEWCRQNGIHPSTFTCGSAAAGNPALQSS